MNFHGNLTDKVTFANNFTISQKNSIIEYYDKHRKRKFSIKIKDKKTNEETADFICSIIECVLT